MKKLFLISTLILISFNIFAQSSKEKGFYAITEEAVEAQLEFLSSDWTEGRGTGTQGAYMASDYIASMFKVYGLKPGGDLKSTQLSRMERSRGQQADEYRSYFQNFPLIEYKTGKDQGLSLISTENKSESVIHFDYKTDFSVQTGSISTEGRSEIIFVGYGFKNEENNYNDFHKVDIKNKIIIRLEGYPGHKDTSSVAYKKFQPKDRWARYMINREKNERAAEAGVIAILEVNEAADLSYQAVNIPFRYNTPLYEGDVRQESYYETRMTFPGDTLKKEPPVFYISKRMANEILDGSGINLKEYEKKLAANPVPQSFKIKSKEINFKTSVDSKIIQARNVIGVIEGSNKDEIIVVGGHYDHLGIHDGYIWNGSDDNASGTVGVMTLAKACMATGEKPEKTIVFAAWTGEEKGLWGSKYFADNPYNDKKVILNLNFDMISRDDKEDTAGVYCNLNYTEGFEYFKVNSKDNIEAFDLNLKVNYKPRENASGGSDHAPFAKKDIPYFYFMAGFPPEYHQSNDHIQLANIPKMTNIIRLGYLNIWDIANSDKWKVNY